MAEMYRDFINTNMNDVITALNGSITPAPVNSELYRDFLNRKADDVITALNGSITPAPAGDELYRDFIERKFDDVIAGIGGYVPPLSFPTLTGSIVTFNSQYALPLKSHTIALTATQSGSGTPSPSNPRPISGYSAINISHSDADTSNPTVYTIQIGSTVYGGEYDARTGVLDVIQPDTKFSDLTWNYNSSYSRFESNDLISVIKKPTTNTEVLAGLLCECYQPSVARASDALPHSISVNTSGWVYVYDADFTNRTTWLNAMGAYKFLYPLATPQTIQLPPCPIDTLEGVNNIFADTGDTTLQYIKIGGNT